MPAIGRAQVRAYPGFFELSAGADDWKAGTPGGYGGNVLISSAPAEQKEKLCAEVADEGVAVMETIAWLL